MKEITMMETNCVTAYPPVISLIQNILNKGYKLNFVGNGISKLNEDILNNPNFVGYEIGCEINASINIIERIPMRLYLNHTARKFVRQAMQHSELLWTNSCESVKTLGKMVTEYKHVMQFMELTDNGYIYKRLIKFPLVDYANRAWKIVVCERNRAYIHKAMWGLKKLPIVLPNKPYSIECCGITNDMLDAIEIIKHEDRNVILYLGGIFSDRNLRPFAAAIQQLDDYAFYIVGNAVDDKSQKQLYELINDYEVVHLGSYTAPKHLEFVKYAHIGLLSYATVAGNIIGSINALYCAPNKIYEYAAFGKPMLGNDILGLQEPFERYSIGLCCDENDPESVAAGIKEIEKNYDTMSANCKKFFDNTDLDKIVDDILEEGLE